MTFITSYKGSLDISHTWDYNNRLIKITYPGQSGRFGPMSAGGWQQFNKYVTYGYDAGGARIFAKPWGMATTTFVTASFNTDSTKQTVHLFANGSSLATIEKATSTPAIFWNSEDHLQSTSIVTDAAAAVVEQAQYTAFGSLKSDTGTHREQRKFTSHEFDDHAPTKYTYAQARYLNTEWGRFLSEDNAFLLIGDKTFDNRYEVKTLGYLMDPQLQNSYSYAKNNPVKNVDPDGELSKAAEAVLAPLAQYQSTIETVNRFLITNLLLAPFIGDVTTLNEGEEEMLSNQQESSNGITSGIVVGVAGVSGSERSSKVNPGLKIGQKFEAGEVIENASGKIDDLSGHGLDQKITRGISSGDVLDAVRNPEVRLKQGGNRILYLTREIGIVIDAAKNKVVTTYKVTKEPIIKIIKLLK